MNLPMSWIKDYVDIDCDVNTFCDEMTLSGSKVESVENKGKDITKVVVAKVLEIEKHPDADKLVVVKADIGQGEPIQIVTGATNLFVGAYVPAALDGATLSQGLKIKKSKLRGVESNGMFCSVEELGYTRNDYPEAPEHGIYIFDKEYPLGSCVKEILQIEEDVVEFEITSNRPDCFSITGLAREAAATFRKPFNMPKIEVVEEEKSMDNMIDVEIKNYDICHRYTCRIIEDVKIEPSPQWLRHRLTSAGIRPINNIVDITNYVMLELGQPMHAYNYDKIEGKKLIVRDANKGEKLVTLDGVEREFDESVLVIQDENKVIDLAGIIGGENSMVTEDTKTILLESANFNGTHIRLTAKKLGLRTDASSKYEKGLDPNLSILALDRACQLINMLKCGKVLKGYLDFYPEKRESWTVPYNSDRINKLLGTNLSEKEIIDILALVEIEADGKTAKIPTFRPDLETEADIAEEVARFYGYNNIQATLSTGTPTVGKKTYKQSIIEKITNTMVSCGLREALTYSFESPKVFEKLNIDKDSYLRKTVSISNPLGEDFSIMRTSTLNGMLTSISTNYNRRNKEAHLFEIGKIYLPKELPLKELPKEREVLTIAMYGNVDFYDAKGIFENVFNELGMVEKVEYNPLETLTYMHPGRTAIITDEKNEEIGYVGEIHPQIASNYDIETKVYFGVLYIDKLIELANFDINYKPLPKFPTMQRDIAMLVKDEINVKEIEKIIKAKGGKLLESVNLFDVYKGEQIEKGYKSVAYSILFRSNEKTLTDEEVNSPMKKILKELEEKLQAQLRDK
ncbi:phenylalanine--tRNA ligase subunit beta [uncultured Tyzzerella sp.]|uniref:phenylalanine--tRNA ligase subunit beta n=1 Tax=uncultured Tyzzerella sp. TaxID=2321398 RepID=UPI00294299BE|nr:phenylalanine--tRNA ligase subunit beta [uncultured Tyzzerella sp.]